MRSRKPILVALALVIALTTLLDGQVRLRVGGSAVVSGGDLYTDTWTQESAGWTVEGVVFDEGQLPYGGGLQVGAFTTQTDCQATYADTSCLHAIVSYNATSTGSKAVTVISNPGGSLTPTWPANTDLTLAIGGSDYVASLGTFDSTHCSANGAVMRRCWVLKTPATSAPVSHATITVKFEETQFSDGCNVVGYSIRNIKNSASMNKFTVTTSGRLGGSAVAGLAQTGWVLHSGVMPKYVEAVEGGCSMGVVHQGLESWIAAGIAPRIGGANSETYNTSCGNYTDFGGGPAWDGAACTYGWSYGFIEATTTNSESDGRNELSPIDDWWAQYFYTHDETYRTVGIKTANQRGSWTEAVDKNGDGESILRVDQDGNETSVLTYPALWTGLSWPTDVTCVLRGVNHGGCSTSSALASTYTALDPEHLPEAAFYAYLFTGKVFYLDLLRHHPAWSILTTPQGTYEPDPDGWAGWHTGRQGTLGIMAWANMERGFARPLRVIFKACAALPDAYATDRAYFCDIANNNLDYIGDYMTFGDGKSWFSSPYLAVGMAARAFAATDPSQQFTRTNSITATTKDTPSAGWTRITCIGDDSGVGTSIDECITASGRVTLSGFVTSGSTALNAAHVAATRIDATHFDVNITTTVNTTNEGTWFARTAPWFSIWQSGNTAWEVAWACALPMFTCSSATWEFPEKIAGSTMAFLADASYAATPGRTFQFYVVPGTWGGDTFTPYSSVTNWLTANTFNSAGGALLQSEAEYTANSANSHHRGQMRFTSAGPAADWYAKYRLPVLTIECDRGLAGACAAITTLLAGTDVDGSGSGAVKNRAGFNWRPK